MYNRFFKRFIAISSIIFIIYLLIIMTNYTLPIVFDFIGFVVRLLSPFIAGFFFAFLLHNSVDRLERLGLKRIVAVSIVFLLFFAIIVLAVISLMPIIINQVKSFIDTAPEFFTDLDMQLANLWNRFDSVPDKYRFTLKEIRELAESSFSLDANITLDVLNGIFSIFNLLILTPVITFYFLLQFNDFKTKIRRYLKRKKLPLLHRYFHDLDKGMGSYLRGLIIVIHILSLFCTILFMIIDLDYPILFGLFIGYTNVIPILGPYIGGAPAVLYALTQSPQQAVFVIIIIVVSQSLESVFLTPYVQSKSISVSPLYILLALVVFGKLFGLIGMIIAIPLLYLILISIKYLRLYFRLRRLKKLKNSL